MNRENDQYEYEYDPSVEPANSTGDDSQYRGFSQYMPQQPKKVDPKATPLLSPMEDLDRFIKPTTQYTTVLYNNKDLDYVFDNWNRFDRVIIRSWDLAADPTQTGTIVRFENYTTKLRSADFRFTIMRRSFQRNLKPNMDRVREEIDVEISGLDAHSLGGIERYSGATKDGAIQLIISTVGTNFVYAYLCLGDQLIIPLVNKWQLTNSMDSYLLQQAITTIFTPEEVVAQLRGF